MDLNEVIRELLSVYHSTRRLREHEDSEKLIEELHNIRKDYFTNDELTDLDRDDLMIMAKAIEDILRSKQKKT